MEYFNTVQTLRHEVDTSLSCLATNKDANQVVVAGRNLIQVFTVDHYLRPTYLTCKVTNGGRTGKSRLLTNSSISDIAWSTSDQSRLATASTNGSITVWNLSRQLSEEVTLAAHTRSAHKVLFCNDNCNVVLSASQDGKVRFFDMRSHGPSANPTAFRELQTPPNRTSPVRDVQYCPFECYHLAVANELGELQLWDVRNVRRYLQSITCHSCSIMSIDWYPGFSNGSNGGSNSGMNNNNYGTSNIGESGYGWLATSGCRDHLIKVWEIGQSSADLVCSIRTSNVNRICWRKEEYQIASSSNLNIDLNIHVWDIKRPYVPFASFEGHTDLVTGIRWSNDPQAFFSVGKDGQLIRHSFANADYIVNSISPIATDISPYGRVATAVRSSNATLGFPNPAVVNIQPRLCPSKSTGPTPSLTTWQKFNLTKSLFCQLSSISPTSTNNSGPCDGMDQSVFIYMAKYYKLSGGPIRNICIHNSEIAESQEELFLSNLWLMFNCIYCRDNDGGVDSGINSPISNKLRDFPGLSSSHRLDCMAEKNQNTEGISRQQAGFTDSDTNKEKSKPDISTGNSDEFSDSQGADGSSNQYHHSHHPYLLNHSSQQNYNVLENFLKFFQDPYEFLFNDINSDINKNINGNDNAVRLSFSQQISNNINNINNNNYTNFITPNFLLNFDSCGSSTVRKGSLTTPNDCNLQTRFTLEASDNDDSNKFQYLDTDKYVFLSCVLLCGGTIYILFIQLRIPYLLSSNMPENNSYMDFNRIQNPEIKSMQYSEDILSSELGGTLKSKGSSKGINCGAKRMTNSVSNSCNNLIGPLSFSNCVNEFHKLLAPGFHSSVMTVDNQTTFEYLQELVDQNCLQTVCTIIIVLGDRLGLSGITMRQESIIEMWFQTYINQLVQYQLWTEVCAVTKLCPITSVSNTSQQSTTVSTSCAKCDRKMEHNHSISCNRHPSQLQAIICSFCRLPVVGHFLWCHGCGHGGHSEHLTAWFNHRQVCPSGCGHRCQFS